MPLEVIFAGPRQIRVDDYDDCDPGPREVKVRNLYSGISHGTEMSHFRGDSVWLRKTVEPDGFITDGQSMEYPFGYGYEDVTEVVEVGSAVSAVEIGQRICCWIGHRETGIVNMDAVNCSTSSVFLPLPDVADMDRYVFVSLATVGLDGLLVSGLRLGEAAVVIGQGVVGILAMQLAKIAGASPVIAVDLHDHRLDASKRLGADHVINGRTRDAGQEVRELLGGHGADVVFEASGTGSGLTVALRCGTPYPKVVALGMYDGPMTDLRLDEEFCRASGQILHSRSGGYRLGPEQLAGGVYHRKWDIVRVNQTIIRLLATGALRVDGLISHRFMLKEAPTAYDLIDRSPDKVTKVIFDLGLSEPASA